MTMPIRITSFIRQVGPLANEEMARTGVSAALMIALSIKGCTYGRRDYATEHHALVRIPIPPPGDSWDGDRFRIRIGGYYHGMYTYRMRTFRGYDSWKDSMHDLADYLKEHHPALVGVRQIDEAVRILVRDRYALDDLDWTEVLSLVDKYSLTEYDTHRAIPGE